MFANVGCWRRVSGAWASSICSHNDLYNVEKRFVALFDDSLMRLYETIVASRLARRVASIAPTNQLSLWLIYASAEFKRARHATFIREQYLLRYRL
ncbi:hypothetical protein [Mycobacteroides abscessus]|uniref:hypothetical protein n=1 Tax=Mycobacteroides abscessus TaxID=36809 RepID=UPI00105574C6|nr:hypothetical protein [Mycobacteroides abscessus]